MKLLLDTCAISALRKADINPRVKELLDTVDEKDVFLSVISFGELVKGISLLQESHGKQQLLSWLGGIERMFEDRTLAIDQETARIWGEITAKARKTGRTIPASDGLIAASALRHGLHLLTRNSRDFMATGVMLIDPWSTHSTP